MSDAIFISCNGGYLPCLNAFLNSIEKQQLRRQEVRKGLDVYLVHWNVPEEYIRAANKSFTTFKLLPIPVDPADFKFAEFSEMEICKCSRYFYMRDICATNKYDTVCLMDVDLMIVSPDFFNLFDMVYSTDLAIGCNERFKWTVGRQYKHLNGEVLFEQPTRLLKFHCNTPLFIGNPGGQQWQNVFDKYLEIVYQATEDHPKKGRCKVGDIFAWNFAVNIAGMEDRVILFPMEVMTQVHQTAYKEWTRLQRYEDHYYTFAGDTVLCLHGRVHKPQFGDYTEERIGVPDGIIRAVNRLYRAEWYNLNFRQTLVLSEFTPMTPYWEEMKKEFG